MWTTKTVGHWTIDHPTYDSCLYDAIEASVPRSSARDRDRDSDRTDRHLK